MKAQDIIQEIDNTLQAHNYVKKVGTYEYQFKEPLEDEVYLFHSRNDYPLNFAQTPRYIRLMTNESIVKCHLVTKITSGKINGVQGTDFYVPSPFDIKLVNKQDLQEKTSNRKTWMRGVIQKINKKWGKK